MVKTKKGKVETQAPEAPELGKEPDWEEIEESLAADPKLAEEVRQDLAGYPELADYEQTIRRKAALQRMLRFASERDWDAFRKELADHPDLKEFEQNILREGKYARMLRLHYEGNRDAFNKELEGLQLTRAEEKLLVHEVLKQFHRLSSHQAHHSPESSFRVAVHYRQLNPQEGVEAALGRIIPELTEATMDCFRRASVSDASPVRNLELGYALRGALVLSALTRAYDRHREGILTAREKKPSRGS